MFLAFIAIFTLLTIGMAITEPLENVLLFLFLTGVIIFAGTAIPALYAALGIGVVSATSLIGSIFWTIFGLAVGALEIGVWLFFGGVVLVLAPYVLWLAAEFVVWLMGVALEIGGGFLIVVFALAQGIWELIKFISPLIPIIMGGGALLIAGSIVWATVGPFVLAVLGFVYIVLASILTGILYIIGVMVVAAEWLIWLSQWWYILVGAVAGLIFWRPVVKLAFWSLYIAIRILKPVLELWFVTGWIAKFLLECLAAAYDFGNSEKAATEKARFLFEVDGQLYEGVPV